MRRLIPVIVLASSLVVLAVRSSPPPAAHTAFRVPLTGSPVVDPPVLALPARPSPTTSTSAATTPPPTARLTAPSGPVTAPAAPPATTSPPAVPAAPAASGDVWACIAEHESGGDPTTDTGNGYYGAFQDTQSSWDAAGGQRYAARPDLASYSQQLAVNQEIQRQQGWRAWPVTSALCGAG